MSHEVQTLDIKIYHSGIGEYKHDGWSRRKKEKEEIVRRLLPSTVA